MKLYQTLFVTCAEYFLEICEMLTYKLLTNSAVQEGVKKIFRSDKHLEVTKAWINVSASFLDTKFLILAMLSRWKKAVLETVLICSSKERSGSRVMPRYFTVLFETTVQPLIVRFNRRSLCFLGPRTNISVLSEFKSRKFAAILFLMSETHASSEGNFGASPCFIEMYSCVSSA
jgi:hypothetical protein